MMTMKPLGIFPADQVSAIQALGHLQQTADAADARVQQASDQVIRTLREALEQSHQTKRDLTGRLSLAMGRCEELVKRVESIEAERESQRMNFSENIRDLTHRFNRHEETINRHEETIKVLRTHLAKFCELLSVGFTNDQGRAIQALGDLQQPVQESGNQVIPSLLETLKQSGNKSLDLVKRLSLAMELIEVLAKSIESIEAEEPTERKSSTKMIGGLIAQDLNHLGRLDSHLDTILVLRRNLEAAYARWNP